MYIIHTHWGIERIQNIKTYGLKKGTSDLEDQRIWFPMMFLCFSCDLPKEFQSNCVCSCSVSFWSPWTTTLTPKWRPKVRFVIYKVSANSGAWWFILWANTDWNHRGFLKGSRASGEWRTDGSWSSADLVFEFVLMLGFFEV